MTELLNIPFTMIRPLYEKTSFHRSVIDEIQDQRLKPAYSHCRNITRFYAKTFYLATRFLPNQKQRSIFAIYGLCRYVDNLVDETEDLSISGQSELTLIEVDKKLNEVKRKLEVIYRGGDVDDAILTAFADTLKKYHIPEELPFELMDGVRMDLVKNRFNDFEELYDYSYKVASVVGLMTSRVFGYTDESALDYAIDLGIAMQLTNILRDVGEDLERDRIYLPKEDLLRFDVDEKELFAGEMTQNFIEMMQFQIARAREYYNRADIGIKMLARDSRLPVYLARYNYSKILDKIEENGYNVFNHRAYLSGVEKLSILPKILLEMRTEG